MTFHKKHLSKWVPKKEVYSIGIHAKTLQNCYCENDALPHRIWGQSSLLFSAQIWHHLLSRDGAMVF